MTAIELRGVSVALDGRPVLRDLSLHVPGGAWLGLIGPNGAGKTTLLRALAGLVPHTGELRVGDAAGGTLPRRELARRIALVPQNPAVPAGMTVTDYVLLGRTPYIPYFGVESRRDRGIVASVLDHLDLAAFAARRLDSLAAASASGPSSPGPWPSRPRCCCSTSPPPASTSATSSRCSSWSTASATTST